MSQNYDARIRELREALDKQVKDVHEKLHLTVQLSSYGEQRKKFLNGLVAAVAAGRYEDPQVQRTWADTASKLGQPMMKALPSAREMRGEPSLGVLGFATVVGAQESQVLRALTTSPAGRHVDAILTVARRLEEKTKNLREIWKRLSETDRSYDSKALAVAQEIQGLLSEAISRAAENHKTLRENLLLLIKHFDSLPDGLTELPMNVLGPVGTALAICTKALGSSAEYWSKTVERTVERELTLERLFKAEASLMVMFAESRKDVQEFVQEVNFDKARAAYVEVDRHLAQLASSAATPGQKADLELFRRELVAALGAKLDLAEKKHDDFVRENKLKFYGPVSPELREELFETRQWTDVLRRFQTPSVNTKLREWYKNRFLSVSIDGLEPYQRKYLQEKLEREVDTLMRVLTEVDRKVLGRPPEQQIQAMREKVVARLR